MFHHCHLCSEQRQLNSYLYFYFLMSYMLILCIQLEEFYYYW